jgi:hypothetical protein
MEKRKICCLCQESNPDSCHAAHSLVNMPKELSLQIIWTYIYEQCKEHKVLVYSRWPKKLKVTAMSATLVLTTLKTWANAYPQNLTATHPWGQATNFVFNRLGLSFSFQNDISKNLITLGFGFTNMSLKSFYCMVGSPNMTQNTVLKFQIYLD